MPRGILSRQSDTEQISWGKFSHLPCTVAGSTLRILDGYGLRGKSPACPTLAPCIRFSSLVSDFCPSTRTFALRFLQTSPRGDSPCVVTNPSPPSGWVEDFHLQVTEHAQHTTISVTDISWLHEQVDPAPAANARRVPHPARLVRQGAPRLRHHATGQGGFGRCGENGAGNAIRLARPHDRGGPGHQGQHPRPAPDLLSTHPAWPN